MAEAKYFNNVIIGQFVLTGVPVKVYAGNRFLMITDPDDVESPIFGFGMDEDGDMVQFRYTDVEFLSVSGNKVDLEKKKNQKKMSQKMLLQKNQKNQLYLQFQN